MAGNAGQEDIGFGGFVIARLASGGTHVCFEMADGAFDGSSDFIKGIPFVRVALHAWEHPEIHVVVSISGTSPFGGAARIFTVTEPSAL